MGRGPQPPEPPGRGGVALGRTAALGVIGTTDAEGVTVAVFFARSLINAALDEDTWAEALCPNPSDKTSASPNTREVDINHSPALIKHGLIHTYGDNAISHIISYRQIYSNLPRFVKPIALLTDKGVDFMPHEADLMDLLVLWLSRVLTCVKQGLVCVKSKTWFSQRFGVGVECSLRLVSSPSPN